MNARRICLILVVVLAIAGSVWAIGRQAGYFGDDGYSDDPQVAAAQKLRDQMFRDMRDGKRRENGDREAGRSTMREQIEKMSDEQRREFFRSGRQHFQEMMESRLKEFFALPPEEQQKKLDERIDQMQQSGGERRRGPRPGGGEGRSDGDGKRKSGGWRNATEEQRNEWRKRMLDHTSPEMRAMMIEYRRMLKERMEQRGVPASPRGW